MGACPGRATQAATFAVTSTADAGAGTLRAAVEAANAAPSDDSIVFDAGVFASKQTITLASQLSIGGGALSIAGPSQGVVVSGGGATRVLNVSAGANASLSNLTIADGRLSGQNSGAGIYNGGTLALSFVTLAGNTGQDEGGAIFNQAGALTLSNCTLSGNTSQNFGGAIGSTGGTLSLFNCTLAANTVLSTNGNHTAGGTLDLYGGASATIASSTIAANAGQDASLGGTGGILIEANAALSISNTIVAGNSNADIVVLSGSGSNGGVLTSGGYNLIGNAGASFNGPGDKTGVADAGLNALADNGGPTQTVSLRSSSPALNAGNPNESGAFDQRGAGFARVVSGRRDIGAFEASFAGNAAPTNLTLSNQNLAENQPAGTPVGTFGTTDPNAGDTFTYSLVAGAGDGGNAAFAINGQTLVTTASFDFETRNSYSIRVQTDDGRGGALQKNFVIGVTDVYEETPSLVVTTLDDVADYADNKTSLREAINFANSNPDTSAITFAPNVRGLLIVHGNLPLFSTNVTVQGPGAGALTVTSDAPNNNQAGSIFFVLPQAIASFSGLTIGGPTRTNAITGILNSGAALVNDCAFVADGDGIVNGGNITLNNCTVSGCLTGVDNQMQATLNNCTLSNNANGIDSRGSATLNNCTVSGNSNIGLTNSYQVTLHNALIVGNDVNVRDLTSSGSTSGGFGGFSVVIDGFGGFTNSGVPGGGITDGGGNLTTGSAADAKLGPLQNNGGPTQTQALLPGSPAIDAGTLPGTGEFDQRGAGFARVSNGRVDIGAYEVQSRAPLASDTKASGTVGQPLSFQLAATDPENNRLAYFVVSGTLPAGLGLNANSGLIFGTPTAPGVSKLTFKVNDGTADSNIANLTLTLNAPASLVVTTTDDVVSQSDGLTSLREAINFANSNPRLQRHHLCRQRARHHPTAKRVAGPDDAHRNQRAGRGEPERGRGALPRLRFVHRGRPDQRHHQRPDAGLWPHRSEQRGQRHALQLRPARQRAGRA